MRLLLVTLAGLFTFFASGCSWMLEPIEQRFLFRPWPSDQALLGAVASRENGIEEVRVNTPDGVTLHGWLKHPTMTPLGERFPLVIVFGGVRRETCWMIDRGDKPERWGWLFVNYRGYGLSGGEPSEHVVLGDAILIYDYAAARPDVDASTSCCLGGAWALTLRWRWRSSGPSAARFWQRPSTASPRLARSDSPGCR